MSTSIRFQETGNIWERPPSKRLDEAVWQAWLAKGRARDSRNSTTGLMAVKWFCLAGLIVVAGLWSRLAPYDVVARFVLAGGAIVVMFSAMHVEQYALAVMFAAVALLYNPVVPVFSFSGDWPRAVVLVSAIPFVVSLAARSVKAVHHA